MNQLLRLRVLPALIPADGKPAEMRRFDGWLQWRVQEEGDWQNLIPLDDITGPPGDQGPGTQWRVNGAYLQSAPEGTEDWIDTVALSDITGPEGGINYAGPWAAGGYTYNSIVEHGGSLWFANADTTEEPSNTATDWDLFMPGSGVADGSVSFSKLGPDVVPQLNYTDFPTLAAATVSSLPTDPEYIRTAGYYASGDGGGALYAKVAAEPTHAGKFSITLDDGVTVVWYELAETGPFPEAFGAGGDGGTDDTQACAAWVAYHEAKGYLALTLNSKSTYLVDELVLGNNKILFGNKAMVKRRTNRPFPLIQGGSYVIVSEVHCHGSSDTLGASGATARTSGIAVGDYSAVHYCESERNYRYGITNALITDQLTYTGLQIIGCYAHDNGLPHPTDPPSAGTGTGDDINFTNVSYGTIRDCRASGGARSNIVLTTYDTATATTNPALSVGCIVENVIAGGAGYTETEINFEKVTQATLRNSHVPSAGISFRGSPRCNFENITQCLRLYGAEDGARTRVRGLRIVNPTRNGSLLFIEGDVPDVDGFVVSGGGTPSSNCVQIVPASRRGTIKNGYVEGALNAYRIDGSDISGLGGAAPAGNSIVYGPSGGVAPNIGFNKDFKVNAGVADFMSTAAPATGTWIEGSKVWAESYAAGRIMFRTYLSGAWRNGPAYA